ncbi:hypothetical protein JOF53_004589 [Crossiella equi]|uniref:Uncharacterized protein n=1 Tax=Crossiella equi TaxID=130796 RepID=A0ABS5AGM5_9PSEU|nr:hypothetical protein [Crossiella equi]
MCSSPPLRGLASSRRPGSPQPRGSRGHRELTDGCAGSAPLTRVVALGEVDGMRRTPAHAVTAASPAAPSSWRPARPARTSCALRLLRGRSGPFPGRGGRHFGTSAERPWAAGPLGRSAQLSEVPTAVTW